MSDNKTDEGDKIIAAAPTERSSLRGKAQQTRDIDQTLRLDGEEDTLYEDGLDLEDDSRTLTGIDGKDDSNPER